MIFTRLSWLAATKVVKLQTITKISSKCFVTNLFITVTSLWARLCLRSPASRLFTQPFFQAQIKENIKVCVTGLCEGNSPVTGEFPSQRASNAENVSIWWCHYVVAGVMGEVYVNADGDRIADYSLLDMGEDGEYHVSNLAAGWVLSIKILVNCIYQ